jgi:hypothetical protein
MPLALAVPMVALLSSGLVLVAGFRRASTGEGLEAIGEAAASAAHAQYVGYAAWLGLSAVLALNLIALSIRPRQTAAPDTQSPPEPKLSPRHAGSVLGVSTLACLAAVATLTGYEQRFVTAPLSILTDFDADDMSEFSPNRRELEERRRVVSNTLVAETFRTLVVVVLFFVLFDAFLSGSRGVAFTRMSLAVSAALVILTASLSARGLYRQRELGERVQAGLVRSEPEAGTADDEQEPAPPPN